MCLNLQVTPHLSVFLMMCLGGNKLTLQGSLGKIKFRMPWASSAGFGSRRGRTGAGFSFPVTLSAAWARQVWKRGVSEQLVAGAEGRVSLLVAVTIPNLCHGSVSSRGRDGAAHPADISSHMLQSLLGKFCLSSCRMATIKAQFCSWSSQNIPHGFLGLQAVMCGKATLPGSRALEFRGKWGSCPFIYFHCCLFLYFCALRSRSRGTGQLLSKVQ